MYHKCRVLVCVYVLMVEYSKCCKALEYAWRIIYFSPPSSSSAHTGSIALRVLSLYVQPQKVPFGVKPRRVKPSLTHDRPFGVRSWCAEPSLVACADTFAQNIFSWIEEQKASGYVQEMTGDAWFKEGTELLVSISIPSIPLCTYDQCLFSLLMSQKVISICKILLAH